MRKPATNQSGIGIIEVMISLAILMMSALVFSRMQAMANYSMRASDTHFIVNELGRDMLELLRANRNDALTGNYDTTYEDFDDFDDTDPGLTQAANRLYLWKTHISQSLSDGAGQIGCDSTTCTVSIRWKENTDGTLKNQFFNLSGIM